MAIRIHLQGPVEAGESGDLMCGLTVELDGTEFPEPRWTDYAEVLLNWSAALEEPGACVLHFMDGPYELHLEDYVDDLDLALVSFVVRTLSSGPRIEATGVESRSELRAALLEARSRMAAMLRAAGHEEEAERF